MRVPQPHFDDELTVLSARPVVSLEEIEAKVKHRRRWFLGSAFAVAMLLGAASALVSAYFKLRGAPEPEIQTLSVSSVPEESTASVLPVVESTPTPQPRNGDKADKADRADTEVRRVAPVIVEPPLRDEEDELRRIRDAVLVDEWQERRMRRAERRAERRERRRADRDSERDLSNLDEIFEGRRRP
jgi:hypothetical protein